MANLDVHSIRGNEDSICCFRPISTGGVRMLWELTTRCDLTCLHCFRVVQDRRLELSTGRCIDILDELTEIDVRKLIFVGGESTLRTDLSQLILEAHRRNLLVDLNTHAGLIDNSLARTLRDSGLKEATVSLDGSTSETHDSQRNRPGSFAKTLRGIRCLRVAGIEVDLSFVPTRINHHELASVLDLALALDAASLTFAGLVIDGAAITNRSRIELKPSERRAVVSEIRHLRERRNATLPIRSSRLVETAPLDTCGAGTTVGAIDAGGFLHPCALYWIDRTPENSLHERSVQEIWHGSTFRRIRDLTANPANCPTSCSEVLSCRGGCRGVAQLERGSSMFPDPLCERADVRTPKSGSDLITIQTLNAIY